jgi:hypothetical protein
MSNQSKSISYQSIFGPATLFENVSLYSKKNEICKIENLVAKSCRKGRNKKSKPTLVQEIEAMKRICQLHKTWDVCELADMKVI